MSSSLTPELARKLIQLHNVLLKIPPRSPSGNSGSRCDFRGYSPADPASPEVEDFGVAGVLNRRLEITFAPNGRGSSPIRLQDGGPGLVAVVDALRSTLLAVGGSDVILEKWIDDLTSAATSLEPVVSTLSILHDMY